ncbi:MAG: hypothetical protein IE909_16640 [Campylobacterales bacterium]|nr:hypothetical protein [Campylobacterales bacterium]
MKLLIIAFTLILSTNAFSQQDVEKDSIYIADLSELKRLHLIELDSPTNKELHSQMLKFHKKLNFKGTEGFAVKDYLIWLKDNLYRTDFFSYHQAEFEWGIIELLTNENVKANKEYYDLTMKLVLKYGPEIVITESRETMNEYPEKFGLPKDFKFD